MSDMDKVRNELLEAILEDMPSMLDESCEVCAGMLADAARKRGSVATDRNFMNILEAKVESGELERRYAIYNGRRVVAYRRAKESN